MIHGIDCSSYQPHIDWSAVAEAGADFAIVKLTEGNGYANPLATRQIDGALEAGLIVCGYHYARPSGIPSWKADAEDEAKRMLERAGDLFCFLDVERNEPLSLGERPLWRHWCKTFRRAYGKPIGWYSYKPFTEQLSLEADWENTVLWLARYPLPWRRDGAYEKWPDAPLPWARVDIWQDGGDANGATWPGVDGNCDVNRFAGSRAELQDLIASAR